MKKPGLIIGQAQRPETKDTPFLDSHLWKWFARIGYEQAEIMRLFHFDALVDHGTPKGKKGRVPPTNAQIKDYRPKLIEKIDTLKPKLIVPVGNLAVRHVFNDPSVLLEDIVGYHFTKRPFGECRDETLILPFPHPSGVSLWLNSVRNKQLLEMALDLLKQELTRLG